MLTVDGAHLGKWRTVLRCAAVLLLASAAGFAQAPDLSKMDLVLRSVPDGPIARVNGTSIPRAVFVDLYSEELAKIEAATEKKLPNGDRVELALFCIYKVVEEELLYQEAIARKLKVSRAAVETAFDAQIKRLESTEAEVIERTGFSTREEVLDDFERMLLVRDVSQLIVEESGMEVTDDEIKDSYEERKGQFARTDVLSFRHMFFRAGPEGAPGVTVRRGVSEKRAGAAMSLLRSGQRFEAVWESSSDKMDPNDTGILRGPIGQLPPILAEEAMKLEPGRTSGIIESEVGFHIIQMIEYLPGKEADIEIARPLLRSVIYGQKVNDVIRDYVWELIYGVADVQQFLELESSVALVERDGN